MLPIVVSVPRHMGKDIGIGGGKGRRVGSGRFEASAAVEDVFYALVGGEFACLGGPAGGKGASVDVVEFGVVAGFV
jgi:hypothetical protein